MKTRIISLDHMSAALRHGTHLPEAAKKAPTQQTEFIDLDRPKSATSPRGRAGWLTVSEGSRRGERLSQFSANIANASSNHSFSSSDISGGLRIYIDQSEVTLTTSGSYTTNADVLTQLAKDMNSVNNIRATWEPNGSRFHIEKTNKRPLNLAVATGGANSTQNQGLMSLLTNATSRRHHARLTGEWADTGRIQLESGWSENAVVINGVPIKHYYTDTFEGRIEAINEVTNTTGVTAKGQTARIESSITFGKTEGASNFSYKGMSVNGVGITLKEFEPGDSVADVVTDIVKKLGVHTRNGGPLSYLDVYSEGNNIYLDALDLEHGIVIDGHLNADLYLVTKMGGRRFDGPSIRLEQEGDEEIRLSMPSLPSSYTEANEIRDERPESDTLKSRKNLQRLLTHSPESARLYFSHGLLAGEDGTEHAGQARRILHGDETLARSRGGIMGFKSTEALEQFRMRAAQNLAKHGYRFTEPVLDKEGKPGLNLERAERKKEVLPLYKKVDEMNVFFGSKKTDSTKAGSGILSQYSLAGIKNKISKG